MSDTYQQLRFSKQYPYEGHDPVPVDRYTSPGYFEAEKKTVFQRKWLNIGHRGEAPNPGDYFTVDLPVANTSLLIILGMDGVYRAFHNMCSHRGAPLVWDEKGSTRKYLACRFHGWVYDTFGKLVKVSDEANFPSVDKDCLGLTAVHCDVWKEFIFINLADVPECSLTDFLGTVVAQIDGYDFSRYEPAFHYRIEEKVNWKTLQEAQLEGWHLPYLHEKTLARSVKQDSKQFRHAGIELHGPHGVLGSPPPDSFEPSPIGRIASRFGTGTVQAFAKKASAEDGYKFRGAFDFWHIFPNFFVGLLDGLYFTFNIWPESVDHSVWEIKGYYPPVTNAGQMFALEYSKVGLRDPMMEDCFTHELVAKMLHSGAKEHIHLQDEELMVRHLSNGVDRCVNGVE